MFSAEGVHSLIGVCWRGREGCWWIVGTLLGPERTGWSFGAGLFFLGAISVSVPFLSCRFVCWAGGCWVVAGRWGGFRLLFENCTVDASIFVAKFLRAHGGCLGTRS